MITGGSSKMQGCDTPHPYFGALLIKRIGFQALFADIIEAVLLCT